MPTPSPAGAGVGGASAYQPSPSPSYAAPSPGLGYSPMTPGSSHASSPYHPATPTRGGGGGDTADLLLLAHHEWYSPDIEVVIGDSCQEAGLCGQLGVVRGVNSGLCSVFLHDEGR